MQAGVVVVAEQQKVTIPLPDGYTKADRKRIAEDIVEMIRDRTVLGFGVKPGRGGLSRLYDFPDYSPKYEKWKGQKRVDLTLSGDMLDELQVLNVGADGVTVGFKRGKTNDKAEGNQLGSYGGDPNPRKARSFLGVTRDELEAILAGYDEPKESDDGG